MTRLKLTFKNHPLNLPKRFEVLERQVKTSGSEISKIVRKIETASKQIESLLNTINVGGIGQFQLFLGESGSGKTTFLRTLPNFYKGIQVHTFTELDSYEDIVNRIAKGDDTDDKRIFIIDERDNPKPNEIIEEKLKPFFEDLRKLFRKDHGQVLLIWPITDTNSASLISKIAWDVGKESISPQTGSIFEFTGLPKKEYFDVANDTISNLNKGETLEAFGVTKKFSDGVLNECRTIGEFYSKIEEEAIKKNEDAWKTLEEKITPKVWVLLSGNSSTDLDRTVKSLTKGIESEIDVDRLISYLDDAQNTSAYLSDWRDRRDSAGFLFRFFNVRLFSLTPNLVLSAIRVYGEKETKAALKKQSEAKNICHEAIRKSDFYFALTNQQSTSRKSVTQTAPTTNEEYLRLQQSAKNSDKKLNKAVSRAIEEVLKEDGFTGFNIKCEKQQLKGTNLKPDIEIDLLEDKVVCLELTWRSNGQGIEGEIASKQNTLSPGHIQKYLLEKVMSYVKELNM